MAETVVIVERTEISALPSFDGPVLAVLEKGERCEASAVRITSSRDGQDWVMVAAPPKAKVWLSVGAVDLAAGNVRGEPAFLRAGPGILCPVVGQVPKGTHVDVSERLGVWLRIESPPACVIGYVRERQTRKADPIPAPEEFAGKAPSMPPPVQPASDAASSSALASSKRGDGTAREVPTAVQTSERVTAKIVVGSSVPTPLVPTNTAALSSEASDRAIAADTLVDGVRFGPVGLSSRPPLPTERPPQPLALPVVDLSKTVAVIAPSVATGPSQWIPRTRARDVAMSAPREQPRWPTGVAASGPVTTAPVAVAARHAVTTARARASTAPDLIASAREDARPHAPPLDASAAVGSLPNAPSMGPVPSAALNNSIALRDRQPSQPSTLFFAALAPAKTAGSVRTAGKTNAPRPGTGLAKVPVAPASAAIGSNEAHVRSEVKSGAAPSSAPQPAFQAAPPVRPRAIVPAVRVVGRATRVGVVVRISGSNGNGGFWLRSLEPGNGYLGALEAITKEVNFAPWLGRTLEVEVEDMPRGRAHPGNIIRVRRIVAVR